MRLTLSSFHFCWYSFCKMWRRIIGWQMVIQGPPSQRQCFQESQITAREGRKVWHLGPHRAACFSAFWPPVYADQCFLNLFTVSVPPRCLLLHHPLQLHATREDTVTQVHPQIHHPCHPWNPDTTICPITCSVHHCLRPPRTLLSFAFLSPQLVVVKKRIASHSRNPRLSPSRNNGFSFPLTCFVCVLSYFWVKLGHRGKWSSSVDRSTRRGGQQSTERFF